MRADDALLAEATGSEVGETLFGFFFFGGVGEREGGERVVPFLFSLVATVGLPVEGGKFST